MRRIIWTEPAAEDFESLLRFIAETSLANAHLVKERIEHSVELLTEFQFGLPGPRPGTLKHFVPHTSHFIVYRFPDAQTLEVVRIIHASRDWGFLGPDQGF